MKTKDLVLKIISKNGQVSGSQIARKLSISRQAVNKHIAELMKSGKIVKIG